MSTSARSTTKPIRVPASETSNRHTQGRLTIGAAFLLLIAALLNGCDGDGSAPPQTPTLTAATATRHPDATATAVPQSPAAFADQLRERADLPGNDATDLAARFGRTDGRAPAAKSFAGETNVGDQRDFNVLTIMSSPPIARSVPATLRAKSEHAYFFVANLLDAGTANVEEAAASFERTTWPRVTGVFGEPLTPGVDGDPRIVVLQADLGGAGGYRSVDDVYLREVRPLSNEAEMVYLDSSMPIGGAAFDVVLAHEFQHLIHSNNDLSEEAWIDEGLSENATGLVGSAVSSEQNFARATDTQLNSWGGGRENYGASSSFLRYVADRFGGDAALGDIARAEADGAAGIDQFLAQRGDAARFPSVFADWIAASALNAAAGPYGASSRPLSITPGAALAVGETTQGEATQFGTDYYALDGLGAGSYELRFSGTDSVPVIPAWAPGDDFWWSNTSDDIDTTLTRTLDLADVDDPTLTFRMWHDLERWYDWGYVAVSVDSGTTWQPLAGEHTTGDDPVQQAYGVGYSGASGGSRDPWVDESVNLGAFAGRTVMLRFEYVTDGSTHGEGFAIDDVQLSGAPLDDAGWDADGWMRLDQSLLQTYIIRLVAEAADGAPVVRDLPLDATQSGALRFDAGGLRNVVVAVAGSTEGTKQRSAYSITLSEP